LSSLFGFHLQYPEAVLDTAFDIPNTTHVQQPVVQVVGDVGLVTLAFLELFWIEEVTGRRIVLESPEPEVKMAEETIPVRQEPGALPAPAIGQHVLVARDALLERQLAGLRIAFEDADVLVGRLGVFPQMSVNPFAVGTDQGRRPGILPGLRV